MEKTTDQVPVPADMKYLQDTLYVVSGKWKLPILYSLAKGNTKFRQIQRSIPGITSRMLARELKDLELNRFITRNVSAYSMTDVDYEVSSYCKSFEKIIQEMIRWGKAHRSYILQQQASSK